MIWLVNVGFESKYVSNSSHVHYIQWYRYRAMGEGTLTVGVP